MPRDTKDYDIRALGELRRMMPHVECIDEPCPTPTECWEGMACHKAICREAGLAWDPKTDVGHRNTAPPLVHHRGPPIGPKEPPLGDSMVVLPQHYARFAIEPISFIGGNAIDFLTGNAIKYLCRAPYKHQDKGRQDYLKAVRYTMMKAKKELGDPDWWKPYKTDLAALLERELTRED